MSETKDRDVLFRIGVESHPQTRGVLQQLGNQTAATEATMVKAARAVGDQVIREVRRISDAKTQAMEAFSQRPTVMAAASPLQARQRVAAQFVPTSATSEALAQHKRAREERQPVRFEDRFKGPQPGAKPIDFTPEAKSASSAVQAHGRLSRARLSGIDTAKTAAEASGKLADAMKKEASAARSATKARQQGSKSPPKASPLRNAGKTATQEALESHRAAEKSKTASSQKGAKNRTAAEEAALAEEKAMQDKRVTFAKRAEQARLAALRKMHEVQAGTARKQAEQRVKLTEKVTKKVTKYREVEAKKAAQLHDLEMRQAEQTSAQAAADYEDAKARFVGLRGQAKQYKAEAVEAFSSGAESMMRMARGAVAMGLASEENTEKLLRSLVKMQAFFDLGIGSINMMMRFSKGLNAIEKMLKASRAANAVAATIAQKQAQAEIASLALEAKAANTAALAHGRLNLARAGGGAAGGVGAAAAAGTAARRGATTAGGRAVSGAVSSAIGTGGAVGAGKLVGGGGTAAGGAGLGATVGAFVAAAGSIIAALTSAISTGRQAMRHGLGKGAEKGSISDTIAGWEVAVARRFELWTRWMGSSREALTNHADVLKHVSGEEESTISILRKLNDSYALHDRMVKQRALTQATEQRKTEQARIEFKGERGLVSAKYEAMQHRQRLQALIQGDSPIQARRQLQEQIAFQTRTMDDLQARTNALKRGGTPEEEREYHRQMPMLQEAMKGHREELLRLGQERIRVERQIGKTAKERAEETTRALKEQLKTVRDHIKDATQEYRSGKVAFGLKSPEEQRQALRRHDEVNRLKRESWTPWQQVRRGQLLEQMKSGRGMSSKEAAEHERLEKQGLLYAASRMSRQDIDSYAESGFAQAGKLRDIWGEQQATRLGYDEQVGRGSATHAKLAVARGIEQDLQVKVKNQMRVNVALDAQVDNWVRSAVNQLEPLLERKYREFGDGIRAEMNVALEALNSKIDEHQDSRFGS